MVAAAIDTYLAFLEADPELYRFVVHQQALDRPPTSDPIDSLSDLVGEQAAAAIAVGARSRPATIRGRPRPGATASSGWSARPPTGGFAPIAPCSARNSPLT